MGYQFKGFFAQAEKFLIEPAKRKWAGCRGRVITSPFVGIGVASPNLNHQESPEAYNYVSETAYSIEDQLPEWSKNYPDIVFVFVDVDCFGGICEYQGYVCQNGIIIAEDSDACGELRKRALKHLIAHLGVQLGDRQYFAPFERKFFN